MELSELVKEAMVEREAMEAHGAQVLKMEVIDVGSGYDVRFKIVGTHGGNYTLLLSELIAEKKQQLLIELSKKGGL